MCGIIGVLGDIDITPGLEALSHRGRDAEGKITFGRFTLGHRRLSIIDLDSRSNQPYIYRNSALIYNGELWNYKELKQLLIINIGYEFKTTSDTEVVAIALHHWGIDALHKLNGMFAFAWTNGESIIVARDRFGEIPIYYNPEVIAFASEQKALTVLGLRNNILLDCGHYIECPYDKKQWCINEYYHIPDITNSANDETEPALKFSKLLISVIYSKLQVIQRW